MAEGIGVTEIMARSIFVSQLVLLRRSHFRRPLCPHSRAHCLVWQWLTEVLLSIPLFASLRSESASRLSPGEMRRRPKSGCGQSMRRFRLPLLPNRPKEQRKGRRRLPARRSQRSRNLSSSRSRARHRASLLVKGEEPLRLLFHRRLCP